LRKDSARRHGMLVVHLNSNAVHAAKKNHRVGLGSKFVWHVRLDPAPFEQRSHKKCLVDGETADDGGHGFNLPHLRAFRQLQTVSPIEAPLSPEISRSQ
jgi:hypothetical protein